MKKIYLLFSLIIVCQFAYSQEAVLFYDNFESGTSNWIINANDMSSVGNNGANRWIVNNIYNGGTWNFGGFFPVTISSTPNQPTQITNSPQSQYLHIVCWDAHQSGVSNANYIDAASSAFVSGDAGKNFAKMNSGINTSGITGITLSFWWLCNGARGSVWYSTNGGVSWTDIGANYTNISIWTFATITNPAFDNQSDLRFAFMFDNTVDGGTDPAFSVDEIRVFYTPTSDFSITLSSTENTECDGSGCDYEGPSILINEVMLSPSVYDGSIYGGASREGEWIELYNPDQCEYIDISCYFLGNNAPDPSNYGGGFIIPENTIIPPQGFCIVRGSNATPVNPIYLVQNGGNTVEIVVNNIARICLGGGTRLWFPNAGGWFAFYDRNGVPQDAISWGNQTNSCMTCPPCNPGVVGGCNYTGQLAPYSSIPASRKTYIANSVPNSMGLSFSRIPDGGNWAVSSPTNPTIGYCNSTCVPPPVITCTGTATATVTGGQAPFTYKWNDAMAQISQTATGLCAGTYCVTVTDAQNNTQTACIVVNNVTFDISISTNSAVCEGETLTFDAVNLQNHTYIWSGPNSYSNTTYNNSLSNATPAMSGTYSVTVTDEGGCVATSTVQVVVHPTPNVGISAAQGSICSGSSTTITAHGGMNYTWDNQLPASASHVISPIATTTYNVTVTDNNQCQNTASITIEVFPTPNIVASANPNPICAGEQTTIIATGGTAYTWNNNIGAGASHNITPSATTTYIVTGTDENFCSSTASIEVIVNEVFSVNIEPESPSICNGQSIQLSVSTTAQNPSFLWNSGQQTQQIAVFPSSSTTYIVTVTDISNCTGIDTMYVVVNPNPEADFSAGIQSGCVPLYVEFIDNSSDNTVTNWNWSFGDGGTSNQQNPGHTFTETGSYSITLVVTNTYGCKDTLILTSYIDVFPQPIADFYFAPEIGKTYDPTITFYSNTIADNWMWIFGDGNTSTSPPPVIHTYPDVETQYEVTLIVSNDNGCTDTVKKVIEIIDDVLQFSNIITPNGDGINDLFVIVNGNKFPNNKLVVFNRWGKIVFEQMNYNNDWDGGNLADGTYYYIFYYLDKSYTSSLTILR